MTSGPFHSPGQRSSLARLVAVAGTALWLFAVHPGAQSQEAYVSYDDFQAGPFDIGRWSTFERSRVVTGDGLSLVMREYGGTAGNTGRNAVSWGDDLTNSLPVSQLRAHLRVNSVDVTGCAANPETSRVRARMVATFFNTGNAVPGNFTGDLLAQLYAYRDAGSADAPGVMRVLGFAGICVTSDCVSTAAIGGIQDLGTLSLGQGAVLQMEWDRAGKRIVFVRDNGAVTRSITYTQTDALQPGRPLKSLQLRTEVENCAAAPRPYAAIDARWDSVSVNASGKP
jgi:hypothetical protein